MKTVKEVIAGKAFLQWRRAHAQMQRLQSAIGETLEAHGISRDSCQVDRLVNDELRLTAASAAATVRIRQILPTLQRSLNRCGFFVREIRVFALKTPD